MRVVYACSLPAAGPLTHLLDLAPAVARLGVDVFVLCANDSIAEDFAARGVEARTMPLAHKLDLRGAARIWPALRGADVVHTHDRRTGLLVRLPARLRGTVAVHTLHGVPNEIFGLVGGDGAGVRSDVPRATSLWLRVGLLRIEAALARLGTTVVPSQALRSFLLDNGFPRSRMVLIPYGVVARRSEPPPRHEPFRVATVGVLQHRKGMDVVLEACARIDVPLHLDILGDGPLRAELEEQAARLGLDATFHGWVADVPERLRGTDVVALATRGDNLPLAVLEAMSLALPVVATRIGGLPELVVDGETGLLPELEDVDGFADAIRRLAEDEQLRLRLGRAAAERLVERFDTEAVAREMVALYRSLTGPS